MTDARALLLDAMQRLGLEGAAVAIVRKDDAPQFECAGVADAATGRPVDTDTVFRIASISKTMTAIGLLQLRDRGLFALDDPVNDHLATFTIEPPPGGAPVTFRHLLTHTSGIGELPRVRDMGRREAWGAGPPGTGPQDLGDLYGGAFRPGTAAGAKWAYANHGFTIVGQLVQDISGERFASHMRTHFFDPLGMAHTEYARTERTASHLATGYRWLFGRMRSVADYDLSLYGAGSVLSSIADMARYAEWLVGGAAGRDAAVLSRETLAEMIAPQYSVDPRLPGMGLAFFVDHLGAHRVAGHDGNVPGFASSLVFAPDDGIGVVALTNTASFIGAHLLARAVLAELLAVPDETDDLPARGIADPPARWQQLTGHFAPRPGFLTNFRSWQMIGGEAQVIVEGRRLHLRALSPLPQLRRGLVLHPVDPEALLYAVAVEGLVVRVAFGRGDSGEVDRVIIGPPANVVLHRRSTLRSSRVHLRAAAVAGGLLALRRWRRRARRE